MTEQRKIYEIDQKRRAILQVTGAAMVSGLSVRSHASRRASERRIAPARDKGSLGSSSQGGQHASVKAIGTVVLVHGAFADGSSWAKVIPLLSRRGLKAIAVQNPLSSLADDVRAVRRVVDVQGEPVLLVGHSWGGAVITEAGNHPQVKGRKQLRLSRPR